ncbi:C2 domain-containing protein, partial [Cephalotus follicularis]
MKSVGILHVNVVGALKLLKMDILGTSDPYVKLSLTADKLPAKKTTIKKKNLNPEWNEKFKFVVKAPQSQVLKVQVFDWDKISPLSAFYIGLRMFLSLIMQVGEHDRLGMQLVPLKLLTQSETKEFTLDLLKDTNISNPQDQKKRGQTVVELTYEPFRQDSCNFDVPVEGYGRKENGIDRSSDDGNLSGSRLLSVMVHGAEDVEGEHHTNPYAFILFRGERKKTK